MFDLSSGQSRRALSEKAAVKAMQNGSLPLGSFGTQNNTMPEEQPSLPARDTVAELSCHPRVPPARPLFSHPRHVPLVGKFSVFRDLTRRGASCSRMRGDHWKMSSAERATIKTPLALAASIVNDPLADGRSYARSAA